MKVHCRFQKSQLLEPVLSQMNPVHALKSYFNHIRFNFDSSVGIALGYRLDDWGSRVRFPPGTGNFYIHYRVQTGYGAHPGSYAMGTRGSFPGVKPPEREADHSPPSSAEVNERVELYHLSPNTSSERGA
jgi:hypothetical protein